METARDVYGLIMRRIAQVTQANVATEIGISKSQMSRIVAGENGIALDKMADFLAALGLHLVETRRNDPIVSIPQAQYDALLTMADIGIGALKSQGNAE